MLLSKDPAKGVRIFPEEVRYPVGPGIGAELLA
jgi:hypothetical protein